MGGPIENPMPYVVKAMSMRGPVTWLRRCASGIRSISIRENAEIFPRFDEAEAAIAKMPPAFARAGILFSVEEVDGEERAAG
jgi:hypothetical protein